MNNKLNIVWIDDSPEREEEARNLEARINARVTFISANKVKTEELQESLDALHEPDLVLMDHSLDKTLSDTFRTGSTIATLLHDKWQSCPIICVTGVDPEHVLSRQRMSYQEVFSISKISSKDSLIVAIAEGFKALNKSKPTNVENILEAINAPLVEYDRICKILPKVLKENFKDASYLLQFYSWFSNIFYTRPGFLYDKLWAATLLGLNESGFSKVEHLFTSSEYKGVLNDPSNKRWWKCELLAILGDHVDAIGLPWEIGRGLPNLDKGDFSKCFATGEDFPETVAYEDESFDVKQQPMKLKNTLPHPKYENMLFFEEIRIMRAAE